MESIQRPSNGDPEGQTDCKSVLLFLERLVLWFLQMAKTQSKSPELIISNRCCLGEQDLPAAPKNLLKTSIHGQPPKFRCSEPTLEP
jgi:hypothetical protein